jgi:hypothetical protein
MQRALRNIGFILLLLGGSSFLFPLFHMRSRIMSVFGEHEKTVAIVSLAVGAAVFGLSFRKKKEEEVKVEEKK